MAKRPCGRPGCRALVERGYCDACAPTYSSRARSEAVRVKQWFQKIYSSSRWQKYRASYLAKHPLCKDPYKRHLERHEPATDLDHINPHNGDMVLFWDSDNMQGLCHSCHSIKTRIENGAFGFAGAKESV